jgi:hypothetical protein
MRRIYLLQCEAKVAVTSKGKSQEEIIEIDGNMIKNKTKRSNHTHSNRNPIDLRCKFRVPSCTGNSGLMPMAKKTKA